MKNFKSIRSLPIFLLALAFACTTPDKSDEEVLDQIKLTSSSGTATTIDFENFSPGDIVNSVKPSACSGYISIYGVNPTFNGTNTAMVFDSSNPTGGDYDLGTPNESFGGPGISVDGPQPSNNTSLGNVLILSEDMDSSDPDDSFVPGSKYIFDFSTYGDGSVTLYGFNMLDLDAPGANGLTTKVKLYNSGGSMIHSQVIPYKDDNAVQWVNLGPTNGVSKMVIELNNSGAIDNIKFACKEKKITGCETAFGKHRTKSRCFSQDGFNRWGWTNGPFSTGRYTLDLYAGAGQCNTEKGAYVGKVTIQYNAATGVARIDYNTKAGYVLQETHIYVGSNPYPMQRRGRKWVPTVAPGQYTDGHDLDAVSHDSYVIRGLSGEVYIIAHAVVCSIE